MFFLFQRSASRISIICTLPASFFLQLKQPCVHKRGNTVLPVSSVIHQQTPSDASSVAFLSKICPLFHRIIVPPPKRDRAGALSKHFSIARYAQGKNLPGECTPPRSSPREKRRKYFRTSHNCRQNIRIYQYLAYTSCNIRSFCPVFRFVKMRRMIRPKLRTSPRVDA